MCVCGKSSSHHSPVTCCSNTHIYTPTFPRTHTHTSVLLSRQGSLDPRFSPHGQTGAALFSLAPFSPLAFFSLGDSAGGGGGGAGGVSLFLHTTESFFICLLRVPLQQGTVRARARVFKRFTMPEYPCPPQSENPPPTFLFLQETSSEHLSVTAKQSRPL